MNILLVPLVFLTSSDLTQFIVSELLSPFHLCSTSVVGQKHRSDTIHQLAQMEQVELITCADINLGRITPIAEKNSKIVAKIIDASDLPNVE